MQAVLLAGGLGTRLRSVVSDRPKPMALIEGRPFMEYVIRGLAPPWNYRYHFCRRLQGQHGGGTL